MQLLQELRWGSIWRARADDGSMCLFTRGQDEDEDEDCLLGAVTTSPCMFGPVRSCMRALFLHDQPTLRTAKVLSTSTFLHWLLCFPICLLCCKVKQYFVLLCQYKCLIQTKMKSVQQHTFFSCTKKVIWYLV